MEDILIPIVAIVCTVGLPVAVVGYVIVRALSSRKSERMELARQGIIPPEPEKPIPNKYRSLRNGFLCIGIGLGLISGIIIINSIPFDVDTRFLIVTSSTLLFLGLAYVAFYMVVKDKKELDNNID